jgi:aryl-alcohol dehydrogenase-like predicted oxidoreductase
VRGIEEHLIPVAQRHSVALLTWSPLAGGWLSGKWRKDRDPPVSSRADLIPDRYNPALAENQRKLEAVDALAQLADQAGLTLVHLALGFLFAQPAVSAPIIGPRTMEQLLSQLDAVELELSRDVLARIDEIVPPGTTIVKSDTD